MDSNAPDTTANTIADHEQSLTFSLRAAAASGVPNPVRATEHYDRAKNTTPGPGTRMGLFVEFANAQVEARDAVVLGWVLYAPYPLAVSDADGDGLPIKCLDATTHADTEETAASVVAPHPGQDNVYTIDTQWSVRIPPGYKLLAVPPVNHASLPVEVLPQTVVDATGDVSGGDVRGESPRSGEITVPVRVRGDGTLSQSTPLIQLILVASVPSVPAYRTMTDEEADRIEKNERELELYPGAYAEKQSRPRDRDVS